MNTQDVYLVSTSYRDLISLVLSYKATLFSFWFVHVIYRALYCIVSRSTCILDVWLRQGAL